MIEDEDKSKFHFCKLLNLGFYISSRRANANNFVKRTRQHWSIENKCHWVADLIFEEDDNLTDRGIVQRIWGCFA
ncbi:transposase family protein, partial [bacterium]|nr:transposase family protein [bacterium]